MLNHCIDMLLVPLTRPCFWSCRTLSIWEMLVKSDKTLRTQYTLGTLWWSTGKTQSAGNPGVTLHPNLYSVVKKDHSERYYSLTVILCVLGKVPDNTHLLHKKSGPSFVLELILLEMTTKPDLESVSTLRVGAASGRV